MLMRERTLSARNPLRPSWLRNNTRSWPAAVTTLEQWRRYIYTCLIYIHVFLDTWLRAVPYIQREDERENENKKERDRDRGDKILGMEINSTEHGSSIGTARRDDAEEPLIEGLSGTETPLSDHCRNEYWRHYLFERIFNKMTVYIT